MATLAKGSEKSIVSLYIKSGKTGKRAFYTVDILLYLVMIFQQGQWGTSRSPRRYANERLAAAASTTTTTAITASSHGRKSTL